MNRLYGIGALGVLFLSISHILYSQNVGINTTAATPSTNAILDLNTGNSGNLGLIIPNVALYSLSTFGMAGSATSGDYGMMIFNTASSVGNGVGYYYWNKTAWVFVGPSANNGVSLSSSGVVQLGDPSTATFPTGNEFSVNRVITQNGYNMTFDLSVNNGEVQPTGSFNIQNGGSSLTYFYVTPASTGGSDGPVVGIGNSSPGNNLLNVSTTTNTSGAGNGITLTAQQGMAGTGGGAVTITGGQGGAGSQGGAVSISAGAASGSANGSNVNIVASSASGASNNGGNVIITTGAATGSGTNGGVAINTTGAAPNSKAILDLSNTAHLGFMPPSVTTANLPAISKAQDGLIIYNTSVGCPEFALNGSWYVMCSVSHSSATISYTGSAQYWVVPPGITTITIAASGAAGATGDNGLRTGGSGAVITETFTVTPGDSLELVVGGTGSSGTHGGGGGGGTFVWQVSGTSQPANPLIVAGGGGGGGRSNNGASASTTSLSETASTGDGGGGSGGDGGGQGTGTATDGEGGGGGGWLTAGNGASTPADDGGGGGTWITWSTGYAGGAGATSGGGAGGYGGGGGGGYYTTSGRGAGGGGGGYNGAGGGNATSTTVQDGGAGGGSGYWNGSSFVAPASGGANTGTGTVTITY